MADIDTTKLDKILAYAESSTKVRFKKVEESVSTLYESINYIIPKVEDLPNDIAIKKVADQVLIGKKSVEGTLVPYIVMWAEWVEDTEKDIRSVVYQLRVKNHPNTLAKEYQSTESLLSSLLELIVEDIYTSRYAKSLVKENPLQQGDLPDRQHTNDAAAQKLFRANVIENKATSSISIGSEKEVVLRALSIEHARDTLRKDYDIVMEIREISNQT